jgi:hypothetical protein
MADKKVTKIATLVQVSLWAKKIARRRVASSRGNKMLKIWLFPPKMAE